MKDKKLQIAFLTHTNSNSCRMNVWVALCYREENGNIAFLNKDHEKCPDCATIGVIGSTHFKDTITDPTCNPTFGTVCIIRQSEGNQFQPVLL